MQNTHQLEADAKLLFLQRISLSLDTKRIGGAERDRTADPLLAKQVLSQLSYSPNHRNTRQLPVRRIKIEQPTHFKKANGGPGKT